MSDTPINQFESACAARLEQSLTDSRVKLWADAFNTSSEVRSKSQVYFGARSWTYQSGGFNPNSNQVDYSRLYTFDIQAILFTLHNHSTALNLIDAAMTALAGYQPFLEFDPIVPVRAGDAKFDKSNGSWIYNGELSALFQSGLALTPLLEIKEPSIVRVGLYDQDASSALQLDREYL